MHFNFLLLPYLYREMRSFEHSKLTGSILAEVWKSYIWVSVVLCSVYIHLEVGHKQLTQCKEKWQISSAILEQLYSFLPKICLYQAYSEYVHKSTNLFKLYPVIMHLNVLLPCRTLYSFTDKIYFHLLYNIGRKNVPFSFSLCVLKVCLVSGFSSFKAKGNGK